MLDLKRIDETFDRNHNIVVNCLGVMFLFFRDALNKHDTHLVSSELLLLNGHTVY